MNTPIPRPNVSASSLSATARIADEPLRPAPISAARSEKGPGSDAASASVSLSVGESTTAGAPLSATDGLPKIVRFDELATCGDEIWIENEGQIYRLRRTKQGKLILTK
ncbi:MAG: hemin uptake protein HemP [Planctomycetota bacterium]